MYLAVDVQPEGQVQLCEFVDDKNLVMLSKDYIDLAAPKTNKQQK